MLFHPFTQTAIALLPLLAQTASGDAGELSPTQAGGGLIAFLISAFFCWKIFAKCGVPNPWFAWIPILGTYANFQAGDESNPLLWTILMFIPLINIVAIVKLIIAWVRICQKLGKSPWLLLLALVPLGSIALLGYLAFG